MAAGMAEPTPAVYKFAEFRFDTGQHLLFRGGEVVPLLPKVADTLEVLLAHPGIVVEKAELMRRIWPGTTVEEIGLARNISLLRKALGDDAESDRFIETVPRRGYRFMAEVTLNATSLERTAATPRRAVISWLAATIALAALLAVTVYWQFYRSSRFVAGSGFANAAIVPFACMSSGIDCREFSEGFTELLAAEIARQPGVQLISPSTVQRYQWARIPMSWMGRVLGLEVLVEGSVQKIGDRVRITSRLSDVHSGKLIWADAYEYPASNLDRAESEAARAIAASVAYRLTRSPVVSH